MQANTRCPVCGMRADPGSVTLEYRGMRFALCSEQCRERFQTDPEGFVGPPGQGSGPRPDPARRRRLRLGQRPTPSQAETLRDLLEGMMGVRAVSIRGDRLEITYHPDQASEDRIEGELAEAGERLGPGWPERLRRAFIHYEDETE